MLPNEAFKIVLDKYKITQQEIVESSGVDKSVVSRFINGVTDIKTNNLQKLVKALPLEARAHFNMLFSFEDNSLKVEK